MADAVVAGALFVLAAAAFLQAAETVPFHGDESEWINAGRYFRFIVLDHDVSSSVWRPSWLNRDQPPVGRYIIGGIVWASGTDPARVNRSYAWERDYEANLREGRVPGPEILMPVRRTMAVVGALSVVFLFVAGRLVTGTAGAAVAGLVVILSPLIQSYVVQARTESLLAFFSALSAIGILLVARRFERDGRIPRIGWAVGVVLGLALATKLTAALAIVAACGYGAIAALARLRQAPGEAARMLAWAIGTGALAAVVWVAVNPFLWPDPIGRTWSMLEQQQSIMVEQGQQFGNPVTVGFAERLVLMVRRTFVENSTPPFDAGRPPGSEPLIRRTLSDLPAVGGISVELVAAGIGLALLVARAARSARPGAAAALLVWMVAYFVGIGANLSLDWPRYFVPTAFFGALPIGIAVDAGLTAVARRALPRSRVEQRPVGRPAGVAS